MTEKNLPRSLGEALPAEMARVRDHVLPYYTLEVNGQFAAAMMRRALDDADRALAAVDPAAMLRCLDELRGFDV